MFLIKIVVNEKKAFFDVKKCTDIQEREKEYVVKVEGFTKKIPLNGINKVKTNSVYTYRNVENFENFVFSKTEEQGKKILIDAYFAHCDKYRKAFMQFNRLVNEYEEN